MIDYETLIALTKEVGFTCAAPLDVSTVELKPEVRKMCADNTCGQYGKRWSCPPGCGELEELRQRVARYKHGLLVQTVGQLEDDFDVETMMETEAAQKKNMFAMQEKLLARYPNALAIGSGCCTHCKTCTYPEAPCRFPEKQMASMEAYGMLVTEVCQKNGMKYYYGPCTLAYTSCFLIE